MRKNEVMMRCFADCANVFSSLAFLCYLCGHKTVRRMELPASFIDYTRALLGDEDYAKLVASLDSEQPVSIRLNRSKPFAFRSSGSGVPWCTSGFYLDERPTFTFDPLFHAGCYYVQEASSMFVEQALKRYVGGEAVVMLDLCAAPGGKSTHVRSILPENSLLIANEVVRNRSQILAENLTKWGHPGVVVTNNEPADFTPLEDFFDVILADVPCSGEGMFRKDAVAVSEWTSENVEICWQRQRRIISDIWPCLKPGGILIYSTCTYNTAENEENIRWIHDELGAEVLPLDVAEDWNITGNLLPGEDFPVYRFLPHKTKGEGFFLAVLRKPDSSSGSVKVYTGSVKVYTNSLKVYTNSVNLYTNSVNLNSGFRKSQVSSSDLPGKRNDKSGGKGHRKEGKGTVAPGTSKEVLSLLRTWILFPDNYEFLLNGSKAIAFPRTYLGELSVLKEALRIVQAGIEVAELRGKDWLPSHALAVSQILAADVFPHAEVPYEQAIAYLRKEAVTLSDAAPRGVVLLTYTDIPLGFVKNVGNRANNLYPQEWRIRSGYLPETVRTVVSDR